MMALNQAETFEWLRQRVEILESENVRLTQELQAVCRRTNILRTAVVTAIRSLQGSGNTDRTLRTLESILERLDVSEAQTQSA